MIIVVRKSDYSSKAFSTLEGAFEVFGNEFEYTLSTLYRKKYPIILENFVINKEKIIKTKYVKTNIRKK